MIKSLVAFVLPRFALIIEAEPPQLLISFSRVNASSLLEL